MARNMTSQWPSIPSGSLASVTRFSSPRRRTACPGAATRKGESQGESLTCAVVSAHGDVSLAELLGALSMATDIADGFPYEKALRTCLLATRLGIARGLDDRLLSSVYYAAMLRY